MKRQQGKELFILITTVRHVKEMNTVHGTNTTQKYGCLLCEGYRHGLYSMQKAEEIDNANGFDKHFGCTYKEACELIFLHGLYTNNETTGENYYQAGKELLIKYGYSDLFEETLSFDKIMAELKGKTVIWNWVGV